MMKIVLWRDKEGILNNLCLCTQKTKELRTQLLAAERVNIKRSVTNRLGQKKSG